MSEPIRILQYGLSGGLAGIEKLVMEIYRNIDRNKVQFDFLMMNDQDPYFADEIRAMGGRIYKSIYLRRNNFVKGTFWNHKFFRAHKEFYAIHCHVSSLLSIDRILTPIVVKQIPKRIIHIHNTCDIKHDRIVKEEKRLLKIIPKIATDLVACSEYAGKYNYKNLPFINIPNCIDTRKFYFSEQLRREKRRQLELREQTVFGNVGVFRYQKNHEFLLMVFSEILKIDSNCVLMLVGDGQLKNQLIEQAKELGIVEKIIWCGKQEDVLPFYNAMDVFLLPSRYEGFGLVLLEAQCCGLPCFASDSVPVEAKVTDDCRFIDLKVPAKDWAEKIIEERQTMSKNREIMSRRAHAGQCDMSDYMKKINKLYGCD